MDNMISGNQIECLKGEGYLLIRDFFSKEELEPLMQELLSLAVAFGSDVRKIDSVRSIDEALVDIVENNNALQPALYDRMQQLPQLLALPSTDKVLSLARTILNTNNVGVWPRMQLRFDLPNDNENLIEWHTDYSYNKGTSDSYTFWMPIVPIDIDMGPILMVPGSHKKEYEFIKSKSGRRHPFTLAESEGNNLKTRQINNFQAGDLVVFHSKFLHSGMVNKVEKRARLVCVFRMQNINKLDILTDNQND